MAVSDDEFGGFRITIDNPSSRDDIRVAIVLSSFLTLLLGVVIPACILGNAIRWKTYNPSTWALVGFSWFFLVFFLFLIVFCLSTTLLREVIILTSKSISIRREFRWRHRTHVYELAWVRNLRSYPKQGEGTVAFDYEEPYWKRHRFNYDSSERGPKRLAEGTYWTTPRFGYDLDEHEARRLIATIKQRFKIGDDPVEPLPIST